MIRAALWIYALLAGLFLAEAPAGLEQPLDRAVSEAARVRASKSPSGDDFSQELKRARENSAGFEAALRDWIESRLPQSKANLEAAFPLLKARLDAELWKAGLLQSEGGSLDSKPGFANPVRLSRPAEAPNLLTVIVGAGVPCGDSDAVYVYDYSAGSPRRVLESRGSRDHDESVADVMVSPADSSGSRLILTLRYGVQCGSSWNELSYDLYRLAGGSDRSVPVLAGEHGVWLGAGEPYQVRLEPDELLMELRDRSIDAGLHNRAHVLDYRLSPAPHRADPVALLPQDFVDEWLTRPWVEMESRSADADLDKLKHWHEFLGGDFVAGDFTLVQACQKPGQWQIGVDMTWIKGGELPEPLAVYFLVEQTDPYRFRMTGIRFDRQEGCPGNGQPSHENPTLFPARP